MVHGSRYANVAVSPASGTAVYTTATPVRVTIDTTGDLTGTYSLGHIVITATGGSGVVAGTPAAVPLTLYVGRVDRIYLPLITRRAP